MTEPREELERLRATIRHHDRCYYVAAQPEISDLEYDRLMQQLIALERQHPAWITSDSPSQRVGEQPVDHLVSVTHPIPMMSIDNTYSVAEVREYADRIAKLLPGEPIEWIVEPKIDGAAVSIIYENGLLSRGATRGNGQVGDDITHNIRTVVDAPLRLNGPAPAFLEVRGELYMRNSDLVALNQRQEARGEPVYANTRNVTAGSIRLLDPRICAERHLRFFCHGIGKTVGLDVQTHLEFLQRMRELGIPCSPGVACHATLDAALAYCDELIAELHQLDFEVDGLVLKVNRLDQRERLGATSKSPRWLIAYKFEKYEASTLLRTITVQVGKAGTVTPVAELEPVELAGTIVSRASLHNAEEITRKDIREGDHVIVEKAGKIIPHIVRVEKHLRQNELPAYQFPSQCPVCQTALVKDEGGVYIRCPNESCPAQLKEKIRYFASRSAMDIEGLGDKLVDLLVEHRLVTSFGGLYRLDAQQIANLPRMGKKSAENLVAGIAASRARGLARLLNGLSIRHVGIRVATLLARHYGSMDALQQASQESLATIPEIGPSIAESVYQYLHSPTGTTTIEDLRDLGIDLSEPTFSSDSASHAPAVRVGPLAGKTVVVTGTLPTLSREAAEQLIDQHGGRAASSVSKKTDFVLAGEKAGSKLSKAQELQIRILTESEFLTLLELPHNSTPNEAG